MFPYGETIIRLRGTPAVDRYSGEQTSVSWSTPDELSITGCGFNPGGSIEPVQDGRNAVITRPEVYAPSGADIAANDRLVVRGLTYEVDGNPADWRSPFTGWAAGMVVPLKEVQG